MATSNTAFTPTMKSQELIVKYAKSCMNMSLVRTDFRNRLEAIDKIYMREVDATTEQAEAVRENKKGNPKAIQSYVVPVVLPAVEAHVVYMTSVFLTGTPLFGIGADPMFIDQAKSVEALIDNHATEGAWVRELMMAFRDGAKYNLSAVEISWCSKKVPSLTTDLNYTQGKYGKNTETLWSGNKFERWSLYNTFWDTRVAPTKVHTHGDFVGKHEIMSRVCLKQFIQDLPDVIIDNIKRAFESRLSAGIGSVNTVDSYYVPTVNPDALFADFVNNEFSWTSWLGVDYDTKKGINYTDMYQVTTVYCRILPNDFGLIVPQKNTPQVWKIILVNNSVIIYFERQTNAHAFLPVIFMQPNEDGLEYQTKSIAANVAPIQAITTALMNSVLAARRRAISDRAIYDPSRIEHRHINSTNPSAKIPVRQSAYGTDISAAYKTIEFRDDASPQSMQTIASLFNYGNVVTGQNPARQGQFVKGNKTQHEFDTVMNNANGRDQAAAMLVESQFFSVAKRIILLNILQYQQSGEIFSPAQEKNVIIDPVALRKAVMHFKVSDGLTPTDKLMNSDVLAVAMQQIGSSAQLQQQFNLAPLFSYLMNQQGAKLSEFEKTPQQIAYEQAMQNWQQVVLEMAKQNKELTPDKYPPQPVPQTYGYVPGQVAGKQQQPTQ